VSPKADAIVTIDGESDSIAPANPANYTSKKTATLNSMRSTFGPKSPTNPIPIVMSQLADTHAYTNQATIIAAQATIVGAMSNISLVSNSGRVLNGANHYTNKSFADLGNDLADAVLARLGFPRVRWTSAVTGGSGRQITFTYAGTGAAATSYFWEFGDGTTSTNQNPVHTYAANGKYTVKCTATSASGRRNSFTRPRVAVNPSGRWTVDATSGKARPANQTEASNIATDGSLLIGAANHLYQCQEASGNLSDTGTGGKTLTQGNTPGYQQTIAGSTSKCVGNTGSAGVSQSFVSATMVNNNTARVAGMTYALWAASAVASNRPILNRGGPSISEVTSNGASAKTRLVYGSNNAFSVNNHAGSLLPHFVYQDPTAQRVIFASPLEVFELNFFRQTGTAYVQQSGTSSFG
jgi:PKD repeat protein